MKANELMIGDWVLYGTRYAIVKKVGTTRCSILVCIGKREEIVEETYDNIGPIPLMAEVLEKNGWIKASGYWVLKGHSTRLGWKDGEMIVGYSALPEKVFWVHELQNLMKAVKISCNFEI
jgi:hypothetical protein